MLRRAGEERVSYFASLPSDYYHTRTIIQMSNTYLTTQDPEGPSRQAAYLHNKFQFQFHFIRNSIDLFPSMYRRAGVSRHYVFAIIGGADTFDSRVTRSMFLCDVLGLTATFAYSPAFAVHHPLRNAPSD